MSPLVYSTCLAALWTVTAYAQSINEITGINYLSDFRGQAVSDVKGLVTAKGPRGVWIRSTASDDDRRTSESIYVYTDETPLDVSVGDIVIMNGEVTEYRNGESNLFLTEIVSAELVETESSGNAVEPLELSKDSLSPPTEQYSSLDNGDVFSVPNNVDQISEVNPELEPDQYGLDFWRSLVGELVTVKGARALSRPDRFGNIWIVGDWEASGENERGGLTMTDGDANPEAILIGSPLDGGDNPDETKLGDSLGDITGVVTYGFGAYRILPLKGLTIAGSAEPASPPPADIVGSGDCSGLTVGVYNVENLTPESDNIEGIADQIVNALRSPALIFIQEVQDSNGAVDDSVVDSDVTIQTLVDKIEEAGGTSYDFIDIPPVDDQDGGQPGGNIRVAYLYNSDVVRLRDGEPGSSTENNEVLPGPELKYNPGRIQPSDSAAWDSTRKPLAAAWETVDGQSVFFTVNVHFSSKGGSSPIMGDLRPPVNGAVSEREAQAKSTADFVAAILAEDPSAAIITAGDFNEFAFVSPLETFSIASGLINLDDVVDTPPTERYTYLYDMNCQSLDHMYVSESLASKDGVVYEHVHVNTWATASNEISDHDPSVALLNVCTA